jgi:nucleotide-binding universal stress UspA family protein
MTISAKRPRIVHAPMEIAGQAGLAAYGLREIGVQASSFARPHAYKYPVGPDIVPADGRLAWWGAALSALRTHDVLHFYYGQSFLSEPARAIDARLARLAGRRVVMEFVGSDIRMPSIEAARNPYYVVLEGEDDAVALARMRRWSRITKGHAIINDPALATFLDPHFKHVHIVPLRVDTRRYAPHPPSEAVAKPVIVHAPSSFAGKGTQHVRAAVQSLQARGIPLEYIELSGRGNSEVSEIVSRADMVIDQVCIGSHGVFAVEAMSMAKPVVCYLQPYVAARYPPDLPMINANPQTLVDVLSEWLERPAERRELGMRGRAYAERVHDIRVVASRLLEVYASLDA